MYIGASISITLCLKWDQSYSVVCLFFRGCSYNKKAILCYWRPICNSFVFIHYYNPFRCALQNIIQVVIKSSPKFTFYYLESNLWSGVIEFTLLTHVSLYLFLNRFVCWVTYQDLNYNGYQGDLIWYLTLFLKREFIFLRLLLSITQGCSCFFFIDKFLPIVCVLCCKLFMCFKEPFVLTCYYIIIHCQMWHCWLRWSRLVISSVDKFDFVISKMFSLFFFSLLTNPANLI